MNSSKRKKNKKVGGSFFRNVWEFLSIAFAGMLYAATLKYFIFPAKVILTGTEGIAIATAYFFNNQNLFILMYLGFQFAFLVFAYFKISRRFAFRTMLIVIVVTACLTLLPEYKFASPESENERILLVIFGGILVGIAKAIAFCNKASTGDEDIPGAYFSMKYLKPVGAISVVAAVISTSYGMILDFIRTQQLEVVVNTLMYTGIYIFMSSETLNNFYHKFKLTQFNVVTKTPDAVGQAIVNASPYRTFTVQEGSGGYSKEKVWVLRTVITHEELPTIIRAVEAGDAEAFFHYNDIEGISKKYYIKPIG